MRANLSCVYGTLTILGGMLALMGTSYGLGLLHRPPEATVSPESPTEQATETSEAPVETQPAAVQEEAVPDSQEWRSWTSADGKQHAYAKFLSTDGTTVTVQREDGTEVVVPLTRLSEQDLRWVSVRSQNDA